MKTTPLLSLFFLCPTLGWGQTPPVKSEAPRANPSGSIEAPNTSEGTPPDAVSPPTEPTVEPEPADTSGSPSAEPADTSGSPPIEPDATAGASNGVDGTAREVQGPPPVHQPPPGAEGRTKSSQSTSDDGGYAGNLAPPSEIGLETARDPSPFQVAVTWDLVFPLDMRLNPVAEAGKMTGFGIQGFAIDIKYWATDRIALGGLLGWHTVAEKGVRSFTRGTATFTGTTVFEVNSNPLLLRVHYALGDRLENKRRSLMQSERFEPGKVITPYVAFGMGAARVVQRTDIGISRYFDERWQWALSPEIGFELPTKVASIVASARVLYFFESGSGPSQLYLNASLGAAFD